MSGIVISLIYIVFHITVQILPRVGIWDIRT